MAKRETLDQLVAAAAPAELIPADRELTAGEIELVDDLAARLRRVFLKDPSEEIHDLLRWVSAVRTGKRDPALPAPTTLAAKLASTPPQKRKKKPKTKRKSEPSPLHGLRSVLPAGTVGSPQLNLARREVLGGLPASQRRH